MKTPSGVEVKLKAQLSYGDQKKIYAVLGDSVAGEETHVTINQAFELMSATVFYSLESWGLEKELTQENMESAFTEEDINYLMTEINKRKTDKKKSIDSSLSA